MAERLGVTPYELSQLDGMTVAIWLGYREGCLLADWVRRQFGQGAL